MTQSWSLGRGATVCAAGTRFSVWAPKASHVNVVIEGSGEHPLTLRGRGEFAAEVAGVRAGADYRYRLDGADPVPDPVSRHQPTGVHGPSRVVDPAAFQWTDQRWTGLRMADLVIYELHVGTFSDDGTFAGVGKHLAGLRQLGITAIEIMPVAQFPGARNWGYDGVQLYAPQNSYGGPDGLKSLVNAAHDAGLGVILDVVYNHVGPEGNYLGAFGPYFTETYHTPWGSAVNYDAADSDEVRRFVIDNALYWVTEFHVDGLRLDAIHGIFDFGARHVLRDLADAVHIQGAALGRTIQVIAESDLNDPKVVRGGETGFGMDAQWSDDLHHAIHSAVTGEASGYYADFGGILLIARALKDRFVFDGRFSAYRRRRHGAPAIDVPADRFVVCIQNHDQVGNRAFGERISTLVPFDKRKLAAALYLLSPYVPLLFMGEEYDETNPFLYFVSHGDAELIEAVRTGRRREFAAFGWGEDIPDPAAEESFLRSRLDRSRERTPEGRAMRALYRDLLRLRREERLLRPGATAVDVDHDELGKWIRLTLRAPGGVEQLVALFNLADVHRDLDLSDGGARPGIATRLIGTDDPVYGLDGAARPLERTAADASSRVALPPSAAALYRVEST